MKIKTNKRAIIILQLFLLILSGLFAIRGAGEVDPTFNASASGFDAASIFVIKKQPDGKFLIGGNFNQFNGITACGIGRVNADGTPDITFNPAELGDCRQGYNGVVTAIGLQSDGKIIIGGARLNYVNGVFTDNKVLRLNSDGSWDNSFQSPILGTNNGNAPVVYDIEVQAEDKILFGGNFQLATQGSGQDLSRLNANGTLDTLFPTSSPVNLVYDIEIEPDGQVLIAGQAGLARRNSDGSVDSGFTTSAVTFEAVKVLPDGKILGGGSFSAVQGSTYRTLARFNADGTVDTTFISNTSSSGSIYEILPLPDGKIMIAGSFTFYGGVARNNLARLNADGTTDVSFQNNSLFTFRSDGRALGLFNDGKILFGGNSFPVRTSPLLVRFNTDGSPDTSINFVAARQGSVREIVQQPDGKILIAGEFGYANNAVRSSLSRFNTDGSLDTSFVPYFNALAANYNISAVAVQPDGKIIIGSIGALAFKRLNPDGSLDASFNPSISQISILDIAVLSNGQILVGGSMSTGNGSQQIARFNSDGSLDSTFAPPQPNGQVKKIKMQPDGKILFIWTSSSFGQTTTNKIVRLNADGSLDPTFSSSGETNDVITNLDLQSNGKIVITGHFTSVGGNPNQQRIGRLNPNGSVDSTFSQATDGVVYGLKVQPDDKILVGGIFSVVSGGAPRMGFARLNPDGTVDTGFNVPVPVGVTEIQLQTDGKILIGGDFLRVNGFSRVHIARLLNNIAPARTPFDYDGDGKADISVFRPSDNKWYILQSSNGAVREKLFGLAGVVPVPADYDGDGKTDIAIYRAGTWWYLSSINGQTVTVNWGTAGDIPRPSDFDGDGKTDFVVYRPSNGVWGRKSATGVNAEPFAFGIAEDKPLIGDFDGDGKSDPAIFRPSTGDWWYASSLNGQFAVVHWGAAGDIPTPADVDADGKTDFMVYRPSTGQWFILRSGEQNYTILQFGLPEDKPVVADYDGDGRADVAVFRPSSGTWYLLQTTSGFGAVQWGNSLDIPTENAFLP